MKISVEHYNDFKINSLKETKQYFEKIAAIDSIRNMIKYINSKK
jgi:hypothetical protein